DLLILQLLLMTIEGVEDVGILDDTEPARVGLCVQLESQIFAAPRTAVPLIQRIIDLVNEQGIDGARLVMGSTAIEIDRVSNEQIESMLVASSNAHLPHS